MKKTISAALAVLLLLGLLAGCGIRMNITTPEEAVERLDTVLTSLPYYRHSQYSYRPSTAAEGFCFDAYWQQDEETAVFIGTYCVAADGTVTAAAAD